MKNLVTLILIASVMMACKNDAKADVSSETIQDEGIEAKQSDDLRTMVGQFIYYADAAVLQTKNDIYGVVINEKMHELNRMAEPYKNESTDYVTIQVRGILMPKPEGEEGWPFRLDIKEIDNVKKYESKENEVIKLGGTSSE